MALAAGCDSYIVKRLLRHSGGWDVTHRHYIHIGNQELMKRLEKYSPLRLLNEHSDKLRDKPWMILCGRVGIDNIEGAVGGFSRLVAC